jgi:hypothetical protein
MASRSRSPYLPLLLHGRSGSKRSDVVYDLHYGEIAALAHFFDSSCALISPHERGCICVRLHRIHAD